MIKIVNVYIVYDLAAWPACPTNNFKFKNRLFGVTNTVKNSDKEKYVYSGYGIIFNSADWGNFGDDTARNVIIFGVDSSSSSHVDNRKNNFLTLGFSPTFGINGSFGSPEKKISINFTKANTKLCLSLHHNADNSYLFVNGNEIFKFKANNKNVNFPTQYCFGNISYGFCPICNSNQKCNNETCQYECKNYFTFKKDYNWNPSTCICENGKYLKIITDTSVTECDEIIIVMGNVSTKRTTITNITRTASINCHSIKVRDCNILHAVLLGIILLLIFLLLFAIIMKNKKVQYKSENNELKEVRIKNCTC